MADTEATQHDVLTVEEAATLLGMAVRTVGRRIASGDLPSVYTHGRRLVLRSAVDAYQEARS